MQKQIAVEIDTTGKVKIEAQNFKGKGCADATAQLELVLGGGATKKTDKKPEFYMASPVNQKITERKM